MYSAISKFKRIEMYMRQVLGGYNKVIQEIDKTLSARRTKEEIALLRSVRQECTDLQEQWVKVIRHLYHALDEYPEIK